VDGVTVGHVCCGVHDCKIPLSSQRNWFCTSHADLRFTCAVNGCDSRSSNGWRTCADPSHRAFEDDRRTQGKAMFTLQARQARHRGEELAAPTSEMDYLDEAPEDNEENLPAPGSSSILPIKIRGRLGRRWTHNEQLMVKCCGIIASRATFFGSESITSDFIHVTFPPHYPGSLPSYIFFDNNCRLFRHLVASTDPNDARLAVVGFPVDVFHASNKHKDSDEFCTVNCSPITFSEIITADGKSWIFNSSAAEQVNRWFGKFQPIVKEMPVLRYNFFLDEMISLRNDWTVNQLRAEGSQPHFIPLEDLETRLS